MNFLFVWLTAMLILAFQRWRLLGTLRHSMQRWIWQLPDELPELTTPAKVCLMLEELGPTYVKMGQIVSSQASVVPEEWEVELEKLQSDVPPFPAGQVREMVAAAREHDATPITTGKDAVKLPPDCPVWVVEVEVAPFRSCLLRASSRKLYTCSGASAGNSSKTIGPREVCTSTIGL